MERERSVISISALEVRRAEAAAEEGVDNVNTLLRVLT